MKWWRPGFSAAFAAGLLATMLMVGCGRQSAPSPVPSASSTSPPSPQSAETALRVRLEAWASHHSSTDGMGYSYGLDLITVIRQESPERLIYSARFEQGQPPWSSLSWNEVYAWYRLTWDDRRGAWEVDLIGKPPDHGF